MDYVSTVWGYYVALKKGYYDDEGLDVAIKPGGPDMAPPQSIAEEEQI